MKYNITIIIHVVMIMISCDYPNYDNVFDPNSDIGKQFVLIEGGVFRMGDVWGGGNSLEYPVHEVELSSFYIGKYEVMLQEYIVFLNSIDVNSNGNYNGHIIFDVFDTSTHSFPIEYDGDEFYFVSNWCADSDSCPIYQITWWGAVSYCNWLSEKYHLETPYIINSDNILWDYSANGFRLLTEAEWEYAARAGGKEDNKYPGTNSSENLSSYAWYNFNGGYRTHAVGSKEPNELGIHNMGGNVYEWCWDLFTYYEPVSTNNPRISNSNYSMRIAKGGSWSSNSTYCRICDRSKLWNPEAQGNLLGFRIGRNAELIERIEE